MDKITERQWGVSSIFNDLLTLDPESFKNYMRMDLCAFEVCLTENELSKKRHNLKEKYQLEGTLMLDTTILRNR